MTTPWLFAHTPDGRADGEIALLDGTTFCISDGLGDVGTHRTSGLFVRDTRILRTWQLSLPGRSMDLLRVHRTAPYSATFLLFASGGDDPDATDLVITRERFVGDGLREDITLRNAGGQLSRVPVELTIDADFADLFEVKEGRPLASVDVEVATGTTLELSVVRGGQEYAVIVEPGPGATIEAGVIRWEAALHPHKSWHISVQVVPRLQGRRLVPHHRPGTPAEHAEPARRHRQFRTSAPRLSTADRALADALGRSIEDLATLRIFDPEHPDLPVIAAGAPWFMALFGRDSLITSMMVLPVDSGLSLGTLTTLGSYLGESDDPVTEEAPGRVPHEVRFGPAGTLALGGSDAYYGSADSTPLFVMALGELARWQPDLVNADLVAAADRALAWIQGPGDPDGDGFIEYARTSEGGLVNQGWKDSWDGINFADGTLPEAPLALVEVQAYAYAAFLARADLAETGKDRPTAVRWRDRAARLKESFNNAFWLPDRGWYAVGLDGDKRPIDALTSNIGHCLWTGIADEDKAAQVVGHLMSPAMYTGWGIRTLSSEMGAYNPISYHNGSVWPHDTALCVSGLVRYGYLAEAQQVTLGLLDAAASFDGRLPELFAGFSRGDVPVPVPYPAACSPQAWASAAPLELLRSLLRLQPGDHGLECDPALPARLLPLELRNISCRGGRFDIKVDHHGWSLTPSAELS